MQYISKMVCNYESSVTLVYEKKMRSAEKTNEEGYTKSQIKICKK